MNPFNREAGDVPAPSDPIAIAVALRASAVVWRAVPYFAFRYGERGRRFGLSDGAWILTLATLPADTRLSQVDWLADLLAVRGMPSWLVEVQLAASCRVGSRLGWSGVEALRDAAQHLATRRRTRLTDAAFEEAGRRFAAHAGSATRIASGTGLLVASAQVDAALGRCPSSAPLLSWLGDPAIFGPAWRAAAERTAAFVTAELRRG